jgi:hypothetical protein
MQVLYRVARRHRVESCIKRDRGWVELLSFLGTVVFFVTNVSIVSAGRDSDWPLAFQIPLHI